MSRLSTGRITYEGVSFPFGEGTPYGLTGFKRGSATMRTGDADQPRDEGRAFGRDLKGAPDHTLGIAVLGSGETPLEREDDARELLGDLANAWSADSVRARGGALARLWIGERFAYGRPRNFDPDDSGLWDGTGEVALQFAASDDLWYGPREDTRIYFAVPETGGLTFSAEAPFTFDAGPTLRNGSVVVGGRRPTWPVFVVHGPVVNPIISISGVGQIRLDVSLAYDQSLTVSTWPWARWILRDGSPLPGALSTTGARLGDMALAPGVYEISLTGYDPTGSGYLTVQVEPAFASF